MFELDHITKLIAESEPLEAFGVDDYADLEELHEVMQHERDRD